MNPTVIVPVLVSTFAIALYFALAIAAIVSIWRAPRMLSWMPAAWTVVVLLAPVLGAAAWFLLGPTVNNRIRDALHRFGRHR